MILWHNLHMFRCLLGNAVHLPLSFLTPLLWPRMNTDSDLELEPRRLGRCHRVASGRLVPGARGETHRDGRYPSLVCVQQIVCGRRLLMRLFASTLCGTSDGWPGVLYVSRETSGAGSLQVPTTSFSCITWMLLRGQSPATSGSSRRPIFRKSLAPPMTTLRSRQFLLAKNMAPSVQVQYRSPSAECCT